MKKCRATGKRKYHTERQAGKDMMRIWSHDPSANIYDLHTYVCPACKFWHVGHRSKYERKLARLSASSNP